DGLRDAYVTEVQTCALPISGRGNGDRLPVRIWSDGFVWVERALLPVARGRGKRGGGVGVRRRFEPQHALPLQSRCHERHGHRRRSEERRVGKDRRERGGPEE